MFVSMIGYLINLPRPICFNSFITSSIIQSLPKPMKILLLSTITAFVICQLHAVEVTQSADQVSIANQTLKLSFDLKSGTWSATDLSSNTPVFTRARFTVDEMNWRKIAEPTRTWKETEVNDEFGKGCTLSITDTPNSGYSPVKTLHLTVYDKQSFAVLGFSVTNQREFPMRVARVGVIDKAAFLPGKKLTNPQVLRGGAGAQPNRVENQAAIDAHNNILITGKLGERRHSIVAGGLRYHEFLRRLVLDEKKSDLTITIEDPIGKLIPPGKTYDGADSVFLDVVTSDPFTSLEAYGMAMRTANKANPKPYDFPTLCGWLVSQGSYGEGRPINDSKSLVDQMELAVKSGLLEYTPVAIRLEPDFYCDKKQGDTQQGWWNDETWAKYGALTPPYETFGKFCGKIRELGGVPFTYIQTNMPSNDFALAHPEWMMGGDISRLHAEHRHHMPWVKFDFTNTEFQAYTLKMWKHLQQQGLQGIKFDYPESAWIPTGGFKDKTHTTTTAYRKVFEICREGLGNEAFIHERNLGEYGTPMLDVTAGIVDLQRVWFDSSHFEPEMASRMGLRWYKNRSVFGYYPDGKSFKGMDIDARRTMLTLVGLLSGRLELGTSFGRMTPEEKIDLTRLYPLLQGTRSFRPVDMLTVAPNDPSIYVYANDTNSAQLILSNNHNEAKTITAPLSGDQSDTGAIGLDATATYYLQDFWNDEFLGEIPGNGKVSRPLKPQQSLVYSLRKKLDHPQVLSTNRHIMQGMLDQTAWNTDSLTLAGKTRVVAGNPIILSIAANGFTPTAAAISSGKIHFAHEGNIVKVTIYSETTTEVEWSLSWKK